MLLVDPGEERFHEREGFEVTQVISELRNLGKVTQAMLIEAGIADADALRAAADAARDE